MSMLAKFVQVAPDLLSRLTDDPEMLESLFALDPGVAPAAPGPMSESVQRRSLAAVCHKCSQLAWIE
jgi:hypothetical protein